MKPQDPNKSFGTTSALETSTEQSTNSYRYFTFFVVWVFATSSFTCAWLSYTTSGSKSRGTLSSSISFSSLWFTWRWRLGLLWINSQNLVTLRLTLTGRCLLWWLRYLFICSFTSSFLLLISVPPTLKNIAIKSSKWFRIKSLTLSSFSLLLLALILCTVVGIRSLRWLKISQSHTHVRPCCTKPFSTPDSQSSSNSLFYSSFGHLPCFSHSNRPSFCSSLEWLWYFCLSRTSIRCISITEWKWSTIRCNLASLKFTQLSFHYTAFWSLSWPNIWKLSFGWLQLLLCSWLGFSCFTLEETSKLHSQDLNKMEVFYYRLHLRNYKTKDHTEINLESLSQEFKAIESMRR